MDKSKKTLVNFILDNGVKIKFKIATIKNGSDMTTELTNFINDYLKKNKLIK